jgi:hypothetical protein
MTSDTPESPYEPPNEDDVVGGATRPTLLLAISILALLLGVLGVFGALSTCTGAIGSSMISSLGQQTMTPEQLQAQQALLAAQRPLLPAFIGLAWATLPLALLLMGGGALTLASRVRGGQLLGWAFAYGLVLEPIRLLMAIIQSLVTWDEGMAVMHTSSQLPPGTPPLQGFEEIMFGVMIGSVILSLVFAVLWMLTKLVFYFVGLRVLKGDAARAWFDHLADAD